MNKNIPYGKQTINNDDIESVLKVLNSDYITQGPKVGEFEKALSSYTKAKYVTAVNSGTSALHLACMALELSVGDIVWTSSISFVASSNCALYCGANLDFLDIDINTLNICTDKLKKKLQKAKEKGNLPCAIIIVHHSGLPCDLEEIYQLSQEYDFRIIEDACHALGAKYKNKHIGNCEYSDICVFSFHPIKTITTGEGGAILTNSVEINNKLKKLRSHGITKNSNEFDDKSQGSWFYEQQLLGFNYRMPDLNAVLGLSQLNRIEKFIIKRAEISEYYRKNLAGLPLLMQKDYENKNSSNHIFVIQLELNKISMKHCEVYETLRSKGILVNLHYIPIYKHPYYKKLNMTFDNCPNAELYYSRAISLPIFPKLLRNEQDYIIEVLKGLLDGK